MLDLSDRILTLSFEIVMLLTSVCGVQVAGWLWWRGYLRRDHQGELTALAGFAAMMAIWCFGHVALAQGWDDLGLLLILADPLMPTFFLHFAVLYVGEASLSPRWLWALKKYIGGVYLLSLIVVLQSWLSGGGQSEATAFAETFFVFSDSGWLNLLYTVLIGLVAHLVLLWGWFRHSGNKRRSILAIFVVGGWGLLLATSFVFPSFGVPWFPYPMLLLPSYLLLLVFVVVRYQILEVNAFANRALLWLAMMVVILCLIAVLSALFGQLGMAALAQVPAWQLWLYSVLVILMSTLVYTPMARLVEKLVYPGVNMNETLLELWQSRLGEARSWPQLKRTGEQLLSMHIGQQVCVAMDILNEPVEASGVITMRVERLQGRWLSRLIGWEEVTPARRLTAEVFSSLFVTSCELLARSLELAETEKKRLDEQHLVELGGLSAAMAHELRNPLNIISMASSSSPPDIKQHIQDQIKRADRLISDMLIYSGNIPLHYASFPLKPLVATLLHQSQWQNIRTELAISDDIMLYADAHRIQQVFINLLDNAQAFLRNQAGAILRIEASLSDSLLLVRLHNNGPVINKELTSEQLFQPFVTKRTGGSGLGLAIVKRIVDAHGGSISHRDDQGWPVTFELRLPQLGQAQNNQMEPI